MAWYIKELLPEFFVKNLRKHGRILYYVCALTVKMISVFYQLAYFVLSYNTVIGLMKQLYFFFVSLHLLPNFILSKKYMLIR